ncbi:hypothetical protein FNW02_32335 [Komarekiella sp. 'clone 1']|uniref:Uncharacterized protein n=1 Tax=Komarekiella delphini-convector SJRDD-AB1 TaxID=2593771 RepID=A0AA40T4A3_9NOST|nr:hypothetical protein [Komarekiella delphini-convector]MBD6620347.1 hypothetical protein [Komarekiella delphini-convector SJRDD-AB1]
MSISPRRLIMTVGDSRVGKSTVMRLLIDLLCSQGKLIKIYDHDTRYKLAAYSQIVPIENIDFFRGGTDIMLEEFKGNCDAITVDMPGQYLDKVCQYIHKVHLFKLLNDCGWRLTLLHPISHRLDCVEYLEQLLEFVGSAADYIVVKNQYFDKQFSQYQRSSVYEKLATFNGTEIILKELNKYSYETIESMGLPYSAVSKHLEIYSVYRAYTYRWAKSFHSAVINNFTAKNYLGLNKSQRLEEYEYTF